MPSLTALRCVACGAPGLEPGPSVLECPACHRSYPVLADVPVMFSDAVVSRGPLLAPAIVRTVLRAMDLPPTTGNALRVRQASGRRASYGDRLVAAEAAQFLRRVHASGYPIPVELLQPPTAEPAAPLDPAAQPRCRWLTDYIPRAMTPGQACLANIRFENTGTAPMPSDGHGRISIAFAWADEAGDPVPAEDFRTPLPLPLPAGQAMTLPVRLVAPATPGRYALTLSMVMEGVRWLEPPLGPLRVAVRPGAGFVPPPHWDVNANEPADYLADQARGLALLRDWLAALQRARPAAAAIRLLEIGGNAKPVVAQLPDEAYNVDVDLLGLQVGSVVQRARGHRVRFICADAHNLPFPEHYFDAIVLFASLHHVPDPAALLRRLRSHLRPGGFIGVFCEPIGQVWPGAVSDAFTAELRHGVNEQGFSLAEYAQIFAGAGLTAAALVADFNSLKARLVPDPARAGCSQACGATP